MNLDSRKISFVKEFLKLQNEEAIIELERTLESLTGNEKPMTPDEFNKRVEKSLRDSQEGKVTKVEGVLADLKEWK